MPNVTDIKTNFTAGELSPDLIGRGDLRAYDNGAATLRNVFINPTGGVTHRAGLSYVDTAAGDGKLISFEFNTEQTYLLVMTNAQLAIYVSGAIVTTVAAPWTSDQIPQVCWTQSADTLLLTHPDVPPKKLTRNPDASWTLADWSFFNDGGVIRQPYFKFADTTITLTPSATTGTITVTASASVFTTDHDGARLKIGGQEIEITDVASSTVITATVIETLSATTATIDWEEQAFSAVHGYPTTVAFHQSRLVIGGSRDMPNHNVIQVCQKPYQFSCWNRSDPNFRKLGAVTNSDLYFATALRIARRALIGALPDSTNGATHYCAAGTDPFWARGQTPCATIGNHIFYRLV